MSVLAFPRPSSVFPSGDRTLLTATKHTEEKNKARNDPATFKHKSSFQPSTFNYFKMYTWRLRVCMRACVLLTSEAVGHVGLEDDLAEDGGQRQGLVALVPQRDVTVAGLQAVQWQDALANQLVVVVVDGDAQHRQIR